MRSIALAVFLVGTLAPLAVAAEDDPGQATFQAECAKCHGADGSGDTPVGKAMKVPSLRDARLAGPDAVEMIVKHLQTHPKHAAVRNKLSAEEMEAVARAVQSLAASSQTSD